MSPRAAHQPAENVIAIARRVRSRMSEGEFDQMVREVRALIRTEGVDDATAVELVQRTARNKGEEIGSHDAQLIVAALRST